MPRQLVSVYRNTGVFLPVYGSMVLPKNCLDTVGEQPPPAGVTGADRMAASDATVASARRGHRADPQP